MSQFESPYGITTGADDEIYVADTFNNRIQVFDSSHAFVRQWGGLGSSAGKFNSPRGLGIDQSGDVYVADTNNGRVQVFDSSGNFLSEWGSPGSADGQFNFAVDVATDSRGNVFVAEVFPNNRIQMFGEPEPPAVPTIADLIEQVESLGLKRQVEKQLVHYLHIAQKKLDRGKTWPGRLMLGVFILHVRILKGWKIPSEDAAQLISTAKAIIKGEPSGGGCAS